MINEFRKSIDDSKNLRNLYSFCSMHQQLPGDYSDLLRMSIVYSMSALDKLIHDIVISNMVKVFNNQREKTEKYKSEPIPLAQHYALTTATVPPAETLFHNLLISKFGHQSFMEPSKLADALSYVWAEENKWQTISQNMGNTKTLIVRELKNIFQRRNSIVHESDKDYSSNQKMPIHLEDVERIENFISNLGETIYRLVN